MIRLPRGAFHRRSVFGPCSPVYPGPLAMVTVIAGLSGGTRIPRPCAYSGIIEGPVFQSRVVPSALLEEFFAASGTAGLRSLLPVDGRHQATGHGMLGLSPVPGLRQARCIGSFHLPGIAVCRHFPPLLFMIQAYGGGEVRSQAMPWADTAQSPFFDRVSHRKGSRIPDDGIQRGFGVLLLNPNLALGAQ